jgi:AcrR family transcriptional regulator
VSEQRERLIDAFTRVGAERGYAHTTIDEVTAAAGMSPEVFHEHFADLRQCLSAAYDSFVSRLVAESREAVDESEEWPWRVRSAIAGGLGFVDETVSRARFFAVDALGAGPVSLERYLSSLGAVADAMREGRQAYAAAADLPDMTETILVGGVACLVSGLLLNEEHGRLAELEGDLVEVVLTPYLGRDEARRVAAG